MRRLFALCIAAVLGSASAASAATITGAQLAAACNNVAMCNVAGVNFSGAPGQLVANSVAGLQGIGVSGATPAEIDNPESVTVTFAAPVFLNAFTVGAFFNGPEFGDNNERGFVTAFFQGGGSQVFTFDVIGENAAVIDGGFGAIVTNCGATTDSGSGCFRFSNNPLSSSLITSLVFTAANIPTASNNSDYILAGLEFSEVPVPGAIALMLTGLAGLGAAKRRNRKAA